MSTLSAAAGTWDIDAAHTNLGFSARHAMVAKVRGHFAEYTGSFTIDGDDISKSSAELTIQTGSILTGQADRDGHLKSPDFLDVESFPTLTFVSTQVAPVSQSDWKVTGDLTIHGVTKSVVLDVEFAGVETDPWNNTKAGFSATAEIDREDFGLSWNQPLAGGGVLVGKKVKIELEIETLAS